MAGCRGRGGVEIEAQGIDAEGAACSAAAGAEVVVGVEEGDQLEHRLEERSSPVWRRSATTWAWPRSRQIAIDGDPIRRARPRSRIGIAESVSGPG